MVRTKLGIAVVCGLLALGGAACSDDGGGGGDGDALRQEIIDEMTADGTMDEEAATCVVDKLFDKYSVDELEALAAEEGGSDEPPEELMGDLTTFVIDCGAVDLSGG